MSDLVPLPWSVFSLGVSPVGSTVPIESPMLAVSRRFGLFHTKRGRENWISANNASALLFCGGPKLTVVSPVP